MDLTNEQWAVVGPLIPQPPKRADGKGRPRIDDRRIMNGILWIMRTGAQWADLPDRYPSYQTCHRRYQEWVRAGVFERVLRALATDLKERGDLDLTKCFIDGTFVIAKKGAQGWAKPSGAKVQRSWQWQPKSKSCRIPPCKRRIPNGWRPLWKSRPLRAKDLARVMTGFPAIGMFPYPIRTLLINLPLTPPPPWGRRKLVCCAIRSWN